MSQEEDQAMARVNKNGKFSKICKSVFLDTHADRHTFRQTNRETHWLQYSALHPNQGWSKNVQCNVVKYISYQQLDQSLGNAASNATDVYMAPGTEKYWHTVKPIITKFLT